LHAVIIHEGYADSGHYYAFIYDRATCQWYRFNDHIVSPESEEVVFSEAYGGQNSSKNAYCLLYINKKVADDLSKIPLA
jgi:ubiquitin carboxyl-terminal hydrolase 25